MREYQKPPNPTIALDDLPAKRLRDVLTLLYYLRETGQSLTVSPGSASFGVAWDLAAAGYATIRPDATARCACCGQVAWRFGATTRDADGYLFTDAQCRRCGWVTNGAAVSDFSNTMRVALVQRRAAR